MTSVPARVAAGLVVLDRPAPRLTVWTTMAFVACALDYAAGPYLQFPVLFLFPVVLAAWFDGLAPGLVFALVLPTLRLAFVLGVWDVPWTELDALANYAIRVVVLGTMAALAARASRQARALEREVQALEGLLPICSVCKQIKDEHGHWTRLEAYISARSEAEFTHGLCPDCADEAYEDAFVEARPRR